MSEEDRIVNELLERNGKIRLARKVYKLENIIKEVREEIKRDLSTDKVNNLIYSELLDIIGEENK